MTKDKNSNLNSKTGSTQINQEGIEDDDSQDREFYKLQKEAEEKKKAGLEPTRSDDINIEVNDKDIAKNFISPSKTEKDFQVPKEDDETDENGMIPKKNSEGSLVEENIKENDKEYSI